MIEQATLSAELCVGTVPLWHSQWKDAEGCSGEQAFCRRQTQNCHSGCVWFELVEERGAASWGSHCEWNAEVLSEVSCGITELSFRVLVEGLAALHGLLLPLNEPAR